MARIAFLGMGAMGSRMARRLVDAGHRLTVYNRDASKCIGLEAAGARVATAARDAVDGAEYVFAMLRDDEASRQVWLDERAGAVAGMSPGTIAVECSTLTPRWVAALADELQRREVSLIDAPVSGSRPQAEQGQLVFLAGGDASTMARVRPLLLQMGQSVHPLGKTGAGTVVKLAVNSLFVSQVATLAEAIGMLKACGIELGPAIEAIGGTAVASAAAKGAAASMLSGQFAPLFPMELAEKDLGYALAHAADGVNMPMTAAARGVLREAMLRGWAGDHLTAVIRLYGDSA